MKQTRIVVRAALAVSTLLVGAAVGTAASAQADPGVPAVPGADDYLKDLASSGAGAMDPAAAADAGKQFCPMLSEPGQQMADAAGDVSDAMGRPMGPSTMFAGTAISFLCPMAITSLANGESPIPLGMLGMLGGGN